MRIFIAIATLALASCGVPQDQAPKKTAEQIRQEKLLREDPLLDWVNIGISTGKYTESISSSVHDTYAECEAYRIKEKHTCFPIGSRVTN